jgi:hypothetical protein
VSWGKADDASLASHRIQAKKRAVRDFRGRNIRQKGREVIDEDEGVFIVRIVLAVGSDITRAKVTVGIVLWTPVGRGLLAASLPGSLGPVGRYQNPLV